MLEQAIRLVDVGSDASCNSNHVWDITVPQRPIYFGQLRVFPRTRSLERKGHRLDLGSRAFDLLMVLLKSRGKIVTKEEIMRYVWPSTIVEDANLRVQMACLRRALGSDRHLIKTISGRGYLAAAEEEEEDSEDRGKTVSGANRPTDVTSLASARPSIVIIDRNAESREAIHRLLRPFNADVRSFVSVEAFFTSSGASAPRSSEQQNNLL